MFNEVKPGTFNNDTSVVLLFDGVKPLILNDDIIETLLLNVVNPDTLNVDTDVVLFDTVARTCNFFKNIVIDKLVFHKNNPFDVI